MQGYFIEHFFVSLTKKEERRSVHVLGSNISMFYDFKKIIKIYKSYTGVYIYIAQTCLS